MLSFLHNVTVGLTLGLVVSAVYAQETRVVVIPLGGYDVSSCILTSDSCQNGAATLLCPDGEQEIPCDVQSCSDGDCSTKRVFLTSGTYTGALGGLNGADATCQSLAEGAGLRGTYKAWLSSSFESPQTRFVRHSNVIVRIDDAKIADSYADLISGSALDNPICVDESGNDLCEVAVTVFTNTDISGNLVDNVSRRVCGDWTRTSFDDYFPSGISNDSSGWTSGTSVECIQNAHLYCFEQ